MSLVELMLLNCVIFRSLGAEIFSVLQGVPVLLALEHASMLLDACLASANGASELAESADEEGRTYSTIFMLQSVHALVNAAAQGMEGSNRM